MPLKISIGKSVEPQGQEETKEPQASVPLQIKKTLGGNLLINDHPYLDIVVNPKEGKISTVPKPDAEKDVYDYQKELFYGLFKSGVTNSDSPEGSAAFGVIESTYPTQGEVNTLQALLYSIAEIINKSKSADIISDTYDENIEDRFTDPTDEDSTAYGQVPPYQDTPAGKSDTSYYDYAYAGYGYYY